MSDEIISYINILNLNHYQNKYNINYKMYTFPIFVYQINR